MSGGQQLNYPAQKWQLIACAVGKPGGHGHPEPRTIQQLWALPSGGYPGLGQVLSAAAQTARGHPHRCDEEPPTG